MRLRVELLPDESLSFSDVVLVVDVIRATTTAAAYLGHGASAVRFAKGYQAALGMKSPQVVLSGEIGGLPPVGFDLGNSPREALKADVQGKTVVMSTTNGTKTAYLAAKSARQVLLASLYNAHAAARLALSLANQEIAILCAGREGGVGLDDTFTAGVLAEYLLLMGSFVPGDGTLIALATRRSYSDPLEVLKQSAAAQALTRVGLEEDVAFCAQVAACPLVPGLVGRPDTGLLFKNAAEEQTKSDATGYSGCS